MLRILAVCCLLSSWTTSYAMDVAEQTGAEEKENSNYDAPKAPCEIIGGNCGRVKWLVFDRTGTRMALYTGSSVLVWHLKERSFPCMDLSASFLVNSVSLMDDGKVIIVSQSDAIKVWAGVEKEPFELPNSGNRVTSVDSYGDLLLTTSGDAEAKLWDASKGQLVHTFNGHESALADARFSAQGDRLVTASMDGVLRIWNAQSKECLHELKGHEKKVLEVLFSPAGDKILCVSDDNTVRVWSVSDGVEVCTIRRNTPKPSPSLHEVFREKSAPYDENRWEVKGPNPAEGSIGSWMLAFRSKGIEVSWWDKDFTTLKRCLIKEKPQELEGTLLLKSASFNPKGTHFLVYGSGADVLVYLEDGQPCATLKGHTGSITSAQWHRAGYNIITTSKDGTVRVWKRDGTCVFCRKYAAEWAYFTPYEKSIMVPGVKGGIHLWKLDPALQEAE